MSAYSESYLGDAMKNLGEAFDYACNACNIEPGRFIDIFIASGNADAFGRGSPKLVSGLSGTELVIDTLSRAGITRTFPGFQTEYDFSPEYWCGWIMAYYQWKTGLTFRRIHDSLPVDEVLRLYPTLHEAPEDKFVDTADRIISIHTLYSTPHSSGLRPGRTL